MAFSPHLQLNNLSIHQKDDLNRFSHCSNTMSSNTNLSRGNDQPPQPPISQPELLQNRRNNFTTTCLLKICLDNTTCHNNTMVPVLIHLQRALSLKFFLLVTELLKFSILDTILLDIALPKSFLLDTTLLDTSCLDTTLLNTTCTNTILAVVQVTILQTTSFRPRPRLQIKAHSNHSLSYTTQS